MSTPLHQAAQKALAALEVCTGRTTGAGVMRVRAIAEVREALANVDQTNTSPERVQKQPGNEHVMQMALDALEYHVAQTRPIERTTLAMDALRAALAAPQGEPVAWGVDCGSRGERTCVSIVKKHTDGTIEVVASEYEPERTALEQPAAPVQPDINCLTCLCEGLPVVIAGVEVDRCVPCKDYSHWRAK